MNRDARDPENGLLIGPHRTPGNPSQRVSGSIHNDEVARKLGFRGGTVAGSIHLEQFPPLLVRAFGPRWFESGSLSVYFRNASTHLEPVRCGLELPRGEDSNPQVRVWMDHENGTRICEGTASVGNPQDLSALRRRLQDLPPAGALRILQNLQVGMEMTQSHARISIEQQRERTKIITEPLEWYERGSPWGGPILTPCTMVQALRRAEAGLEGLGQTRAVGLFGAIELRFLNGPLFVDRDYMASGRVVAVGETPKTEYLWYESTLKEPGTGTAIASMLMMLRFMKASLPPGS
jgi:hypothetical protein